MDQIEPGQPAKSGPTFAGYLGWSVLFLVAGVAGATYGLAGYRLFDSWFSVPAQGRSGLMLRSFLVGIPLVIGMVAAWVMTRRRRRPFWPGMLGSGLPVLLFVFLAGIWMGEGFICIVMAFPLFLLFSAAGYAIYWALEHFASGHAPKLLSVSLAVPLLLGVAEQREAPPAPVVSVVEQSILIQAPASVVWRHINHPLDIRPQELAGGWAYRIGVPYPIEARTLEGRVGGLRELKWQRGVSFEEVITAYEPQKHIAWRYQFRPESFPPGALDDHIRIGGRYFDLVDTAYTLTPESGSTRLAIKFSYIVNTNFDWYARPWAQFLVGDTAQAILGFYRLRSEARPAGA